MCSREWQWWRWDGNWQCISCSLQACNLSVSCISRPWTVPRVHWGAWKSLDRNAFVFVWQMEMSQRRTLLFSMRSVKCRFLSPRISMKFWRSASLNCPEATAKLANRYLQLKAVPRSIALKDLPFRNCFLWHFDLSKRMCLRKEKKNWVFWMRVMRGRYCWWYVLTLQLVLSWRSCPHRSSVAPPVFTSLVLRSS